MAVITSSKTDPTGGSVLHGSGTPAPAGPARTAVEEKRKLLVKENREASKEIAELGEQLDDFSRQLRALQDLHQPATDVLEEIPVNSLDERRLDGSIRQVQLLRTEVRRVSEDVEEKKTIVLSSATTTAVTATSIISAEYWIGQVPSDLLPRHPQTLAKKRYLAVAARPPLLNDAHELLVAFGLGTSFYGRSPADSLRGAERALMVGAHNAQATGGVLMNLRSAIDDMLAALSRRRPIQEQGDKLPEKIQSLGRHCGLLSLQPEVFERLGADGKLLHDDLTKGKQAELPREALIEVFNRAVTWIAAVLRSLDQSRMKQLSSRRA